MTKRKQKEGYANAQRMEYAMWKILKENKTRKNCTKSQNYPKILAFVCDSCYNTKQCESTTFNFLLCVTMYKIKSPYLHLKYVGYNPKGGENNE